MEDITSWQGVALAAWAILEYWLGTTDAVEAGSSLELVLNFIKKALGLLE